MLGTPQREANGTSLAVIVPWRLSCRHPGRWTPGHLEVGIPLAIGAVGGAVLGARLTRRLSDWFSAGVRHHGPAVAIVMIADAVCAPWRQRAPDRRSQSQRDFLWIMALVVGAAAGVLSGLLALGRRRDVRP